jgi:SAM-dependent methyltransferase
VPTPEVTDRQPELVQEALGQLWYHAIELAPGVVTPGRVDWRGHASKILPSDLSGKRALDVATFDGFWAFELERRGAEVTALDLASFSQVEIPPPNRERILSEVGDHVPGERFHLAARIIGSTVNRVEGPVYELDAELIGGPVDVALIGDLLLHLRDPVRALERVRSVLAPGGRLYLVEQVSALLTVLRPRRAAASMQARVTDFNWWVANARCLRDWLELAGFERIERRHVFRLKAPRPQGKWHVAYEAWA